jgi:hypothetical protein
MQLNKPFPQVEGKGVLKSPLRALVAYRSMKFHECMLQARLRIIDAVRLHLFPRPLFKVKHAFPIPYTDLALLAAFYQPVNLSQLSLDRLGRAGQYSRPSIMPLAFVPPVGLAGQCVT